LYSFKTLGNALEHTFPELQGKFGKLIYQSFDTATPSLFVVAVSCAFSFLFFFSIGHGHTKNT